MSIHTLKDPNSVKLALEEFDHLGEQLSAKMVGDLPTVIGLRIGRAVMLSVGIPQNLVFAAPNHPLVAPKLDGLLAGLRRVHAGQCHSPNLRVNGGA